VAARGAGAEDAFRHRRAREPHARGSRPGLRGDARAHPPDRGQGAAQAAPPEPQPAAEELHGVASIARCKMLRTLRALGLLAIALLLGCSTIDSRIHANQGLFDSYPPDVQSKIRAGVIGVGFTPDMVTMAWGEPSRREQVTGEEFVSDVWTWTRSAPG